MQLPLFGPCCGREGRWPVRAIRVRWTEGVGSEAVEAGRSGDGGAGCDPTLVKYVCHMAVAGVLAYHGRGLQRYPRPSLRRQGRRGRLW
jgi:hypothetical protein